MDLCLFFLLFVVAFGITITGLVLQFNPIRGIPLGATRILPGWSVAIIGGVLMTPFCCGQGSLMAYGAYRGADYASKNRGKTMDVNQLADLQKEVLIPTLIIDAVSLLLAFAIALGVGLITIMPRPSAEPSSYGYSPPPPDQGGYRPPSSDQGFRPGGPGNWPGGS
jgi:hypothetical protein